MTRAAPHVIILGSGIAGLSCAAAAIDAGCDITVVTKGELAHTATRYAQGGIAGAFGAGDRVEDHLHDTLIAGVGLCDEDAVRILVTEGPGCIRSLAALGAIFDQDSTGAWALAREGGHGRARVVHAGGDQTGAEIERALVANSHARSIETREHWFVTSLIIEHGQCVGIRGCTPQGETELRGDHVVLAAGGAGQCFAVTTNPVVACGDAVALALEAGVLVADIEFMQFHPTALYCNEMPRPLLSEALRGEGAILRDAHGIPFMQGRHPLADLAPRDVVSRAVAGIMAEQGLNHVWLDATMIENFPVHFPTIWASTQGLGLNPETDWLPCAPAAHYLSGGAIVDLDGATSMPGLWACGEAACSGVHGANRLASNSLLDGLVFGRRVAQAIAADKTVADSTGVMRGCLDLVGQAAPDLDAGMSTAAETRALIQNTMSTDCGVIRNEAGLLRASTILEFGVQAEAADVAGHEVNHLLRCADGIVTAASAREESRGAHTRTDYPDTSDSWRGRIVLGAGEPTFVPLPD